MGFVRARVWASQLRFITYAMTLTLLCTGAAGAAIPPAEQAYIDTLIREVAEAHGMVFIRNGLEYSSADAAEHLHNKLNYFRNEIHTADDFIRLCATKSEMTGLAYHVREPNGTVLESAVFLNARLAQLRQASSAGAPAPAPASPATPAMR